LGAKRISVLNLGVAGASMQFMVNPLALIARRFSADLVIVNFIAADLNRRHGDDYSSHNPDPPLPAEPTFVTDTPPSVSEPDLQVDGVGIDLMGCEPRTLSNPACRISSYFTVRPGVLMRIKAKLGSMVFWSRIVTSAKPLLLLEVMGRPAVARPPAPHFLRKLLRREPPLMTDIVQPAEKEAEDLTIGLRAIRAIHAMHHDLMLIHNPTYWYLNGQLREPAVQPLAASLKDDGLEITRMMKYLPAAAKERDWFKWYNLPHDGHWSDLGAEVYGLAVHHAVREHLLGNASRP
jgi:hypothetical protein